MCIRDSLGGIPISLSTSGGALIAGLVFGWLRSKHPTFGGIPEPSLWVLNNVGLNMFIAVVGIAAGPSFVTGFKEVGFSLFIVGALATAIPLLSGLLMGRYLFKFHPALTLGCTAGARTTTAALGAIQDALGSDTPALGYKMCIRDRTHSGTLHRSQRTADRRVSPLHRRSREGNCFARFA